MYKKTRLFVIVCALVMSTFQLGTMVPDVAGVNDFEPNVLVSWSQQVRHQRNSSIAVGPNGLIHVVWTHQTPLDDTDIHYAKSIDGGATFIGHKTVHWTTEGFQAMPDIAVSSNGWIHVVWSDNRQNPIEWQTNFIYYARSIDGGDSFEEEFAISGVSPYPSETSEMVQTNPTLDVDDDVVCTVHVAWNLIEEPVTILWGLDYDKSDQCGDYGTFGTDIRVDQDGYTPSIAVDGIGNPHIGYRSILNDIMHIRSSNGGSSWGTPTTVNDHPGHGGHFEPDIAIDVFDYIHMAWTDTRAMVPPLATNNRDIYYAKSTDGGDNFGTNLLVNNYDYYPGGSTFPGQFDPSLGVDDNGNPHVAFSDFREDIDGWFSETPGNPDDVNIYYANSVDGGETFMEDNWRVNEEDLLEQPKLSPSAYVVGYTGLTPGVHVTWDDARDYDPMGVDIYYSGSVNIQPELDWCGLTGLQTDGVDPDIGTDTTLFTYCVKYADADNDPPALGRPVVRIDDGYSVSEYEMSFDSFSIRDKHYDDGAIYIYETTLPFGLNFEYEFYVMDSFGMEDSLSGIGPEVYHLPVLEWCQYDNWIDTGVDPEVGTTADEFVYCIKYSQADGVAPDWVKVHIYDLGVEIQPGGFEMLFLDFVTPGSGNWADGAYFTHTQSLPAGTDYSYDFETEILQGEINPGLFPPTGPKPGPEVYDHPILIWCDEEGFITDGVKPDDGRPDETDFTYCIKYIQDGDFWPDSPPELWIYDDGDMQNYRWKHTMDYQYGTPATGGAVYKYTRKLPLPNVEYYYNFHITVNPIGVDEFFPPTPMAGPDVYYIPELSWCQETGYFDDGVNPDFGTTETEFVYCVVYTHEGGLDPKENYPLLVIYDEGGAPRYVEPMVEISGDPPSGEIYKLSKVLPEAGLWSYKIWVVDEDDHEGEPLPPGPESNRKDGPEVYTHPTLEWCGDPGIYETDGVNPDEGEPGTEFTYCIIYIQAEDMDPEPNLVILDVYDGLPSSPDTYYMNEVSGTPSTGERWEYQLPLGNPTIGWYYDFLLWFKGEEIRYPEPPKAGPGVYYIPELSWCGDSGIYETDGVNPDEGNTIMEFVYCVKYSHPEGLGPSSGNPKVNIYKGTQLRTTESLSCESGDIVAGVKCLSSGLILDEAGSDWNYQFIAEDIENHQAHDFPASPKDGPLVHNAPELDWCGESGFETDGVNPDRGSPGETFTYCVKYTHADNVEPKDDYPEVVIYLGATEEDRLSMTKQGGDPLSGEIYKVSTSLQRGLWSYQFEVLDINEFPGRDFPVPKKDGPIVNSAPELDWCGDVGKYETDGVDPETGMFGATFTYCIEYTDADNDAPTNIKVRIYSHPSWDPHDMIPRGGGDGDYTNGEEYVFSISTLVVGDHKYQFEASDGLEDVWTTWKWNPFVRTNARGPWWKIQHDLENTGYTSASSPNGAVLDWPYHDGWTTSSSPVIDENDILYIGHSKQHKILAFNRLDGTKLWEKPLAGSVYDAPAALNGRVYIGDTEKFYAFTYWGDKRFEIPVSGGLHGSSPTVFDQRIVFGTPNGVVFCLDELNGDTVWTFTAAKSQEEFRTAPGVFTDSNSKRFIHIASNRAIYGIPAVEPTPVDKVMTSLDVWEDEFNSDIHWDDDYVHSSPTIAEGRVIWGSGTDFPYRLMSWVIPNPWVRTGYSGFWETLLPIQDNVMGSPAYDNNGQVWIGCDDDETGMGSPMWPFRISDGWWNNIQLWTGPGHDSFYRSSPAISSGNKIFVLAGGHLVALKMYGGDPFVPLWSYEVSNSQWGYGSSPIVVSGKVYTGGHKGEWVGNQFDMLYAFK